MKIAVIGLGSIGRRHAENFRALGCDVTTWDVREDSGRTHDTLPGALRGSSGAVIATPPDVHVKDALVAAVYGARVMIEKPLSTSVEHAQAIALENTRILVAYPWRHWPPLQYVKDRLPEIGRILSARIEYGAHLEKHYPTHANRPDSYMRDLSRGGGCLLDCSHAIDLMRWLCGEITEVSALVERRMLDMNADDSADLTVKFASGASGGIHMSLCLPEVRGRLEIVGENGAIQWERGTNVVRWRVGNGLWFGNTSGYAPGDVSEMYLNEARHFLACIRGEATPVCDGWDGLQTLRVCEAARRASDERRWVTV